MSNSVGLYAESRTLHFLFLQMVEVLQVPMPGEPQPEMKKCWLCFRDFNSFEELCEHVPTCNINEIAAECRHLEWIINELNTLMDRERELREAQAEIQNRLAMTLTPRVVVSSKKSGSSTPRHTRH